MSFSDDPLPIDDVLPRLLTALDVGPAAVLVAPPGTGKTTHAPLALLDAPWRGGRKIIVLEPRRLAARAAAARMAALLGEEVGDTVGYRVRLDAKVSRRTRIEVVTEGVFTRMILADPELGEIAAVIFDEFHERSLEGDLGLALVLDARGLRDDLRVVVMSATIDGAAVARLLAGAPVIESAGRTFPVETRHVERDPAIRLEDQVVSVILAAIAAEAGSTLVFLPGQGEIARVAERLTERVPATVDIVPLFGQLSPAEQDQAIRPAAQGRRKIVLATSIAETSLTIERVRIVIDSGYRRAPAFDPASGLAVLETRRVSRAAADQRRGRAGRTEPGVCYRLWNERQTATLAAFDRPEILEAELSGFALDLAGWGIADPAKLAFLDPPPAPAWREAVTLLKSLEAIDADGRITDEGRALARMPLHPRLGHMVHRASEEGEGLVAAELAVLLTERGLGGDDIDLLHRLNQFRRDRSRRGEEARRLARRWAGTAGAMGTADAPESIGRHLARAYPDRIAQAAGAPGRFRLANGRAASVEASHALAREAFLVVTDVTGSAANGRIRGAGRIDVATIEELFGDRISEETAMEFDAGSRSIRARQVRRLGALRLAEHPAPPDDLEKAAELLVEGIAAVGVDALPWTSEQNSLRARATYLHQRLGEPWPDLSDMALAREPEGWLTPFIIGRTALGDITADDLAHALGSRLSRAEQSELERLLPSHFEAPTGSRVPIDYGAENGPAIEIRVQELFGLDRHPAVGGGKIPLLVVLLSPAHRPIQTTRDLPGFWRGSWRDVAKDLKGRYPRHFWPDDPLAAAATRRAKPRA